jgi:phosphatidylserine/phosphatidylglycerophosphate/cardiolipin synthase-like enzyme
VAEALHAKVYLFESPRNELFGLIGSYNPTNAAANNNVEIGVFLASRPRTPEWKNLFELRTFLKNSARPFNNDVRASN